MYTVYTVNCFSSFFWFSPSHFVINWKCKNYKKQKYTCFAFLLYLTIMTSVLEDNVDNLRENNTTSGLQSTNGNPYGVSFEEDDEGDKQDEEENEVVDDIDGEIVGEEDENDNTEDNVNKARANIDENPWIKVVEKSLQDVDIEFDSVSKMMLEKVNEQIPLLLEKLHQEMLSEIMTCPSEMGDVQLHDILRFWLHRFLCHQREPTIRPSSVHCTGSSGILE